VIRYNISKRDLKAAVEALKPGWLKRARQRTQAFKKQGFYKESSSIWSEIKAVYIKHQHAKCAYCEKQLEDEERGKSEHDVEHFRPKSSVAPWKPPKDIRNLNIPLTPPDSNKRDPGYHLLAYHLFNYATACKPCNSALKGNKFPIAGTRNSNGQDPSALQSEKPYLIYPISKIDTDPKKLIRFHGLSPQPIFKSGHRRNRALVTIAFFELDTGKRQKTLFKQRAKIITSLHSFLTQREQAAQANNAQGCKLYQDLIDSFSASSEPHSNCAKSFVKLFSDDRVEADDINILAAEYLSSVST